MFHGHVYFGLRNAQLAEDFRQKLIQERKDAIEVFPLVQRLVGPHKMPMFEIHFKNNDNNLIEWLEAERGDMSVLIHPVTGGEELLDHTERAIWLGRELGVFEETLSS
ncbi:MAG: DOPA 4,5-dioxygenase family protein [Vibrio gallaecicus]|uniref:DOPA 4,5-dioxygenase family protein n=1 Tax=Vibrio gallaecicus TaxID=552386 RepID=A0ABV4N8Z4_9VIBR|nr:DOPA 4,5-dioxygenase family protein [Vibrio gallaecicus]MDN3616654.1 DOPA 4,5-dioxygenase family protein [Vibrio gallaecicus]